MSGVSELCLSVMSDFEKNICLIVSEKSLIVVLMSCLLSCVSAYISLFSNVVFLFELSRYLILDIVLITSTKQA